MQCFRRATSEKLLPALPATHINKQNGGTNRIIRNYDFPICVQIKNVKEKKNTQQETGYAAETV
jgi:hypothetical protein